MFSVLRIPVAKDRLRAMPKQERALFLLLGSAANQITLLTKLIIFSTNKTPDGVEQAISGAQSQMIVRLAIGALYEAWELVRKGFLKTSLGTDYATILDDGGIQSLEKLKKYFGTSNIINKIRNQYVFHHPYDVGLMDAAFEAAATDATLDNEWNWYFSNSNFNSFYFMSDIIVLHGILRAVGETDLIEAQKKIMNEVSQVSDDMTQFIMALTDAFWRKHFGPSMNGEVCAVIDSAPGLFDMWLPFFVDTEDAQTQSREGNAASVS